MCVIFFFFFFFNVFSFLSDRLPPTLIPFHVLPYAIVHTFWLLFHNLIKVSYVLLSPMIVYILNLYIELLWGYLFNPIQQKGSYYKPTKF